MIILLLLIIIGILLAPYLYELFREKPFSQSIGEDINNDELAKHGLARNEDGGVMPKEWVESRNRSLMDKEITT